MVWVHEKTQKRNRSNDGFVRGRRRGTIKRCVDRHETDEPERHRAYWVSLQLLSHKQTHTRHPLICQHDRHTHKHTHTHAAPVYWSTRHTHAPAAPLSRPTPHTLHQTVHPLLTNNENSQYTHALARPQLTCPSTSLLLITIHYQRLPILNRYNHLTILFFFLC